MIRKWAPWIGLALGAALLVWVLRGFDFARFIDVLSRAEPWPLVPLVAILFADGLIRAEKWRHMLTPIRTVRRGRLFGAIMGGYFVNIVTPVRVSPLVRAWLVARLEKLPVGSVLTTIALDRVVDGFVFLGISGLLLVWQGFPDGKDQIYANLVWGSLAALAALSAVVAVLVWLRGGLDRRIAALLMLPGLRRLPERWREFIDRVCGDFAAGVVWPAEIWRTVVIIVASIAMKLLAASHFMWAGLAFGVILAPVEYLYLMVFMGFMVVLTGSLRIVGGFTAGAVYFLGSYGVEVETALAMTLVVQAAVHLVITASGLPALWMQGVTLRSLRQAGAKNLPIDGRHA